MMCKYSGNSIAYTILYISINNILWVLSPFNMEFFMNSAYESGGQAYVGTV